MSVRVIVADTSCIRSDPDGLHPVEQNAVDGMMTQCALCAVTIGLYPVGHRIEDVQAVESAYPYFTRGRLVDATDVIVG